jgi:hypothetical protein
MFSSTNGFDCPFKVEAVGERNVDAVDIRIIDYVYEMS